ncbi:MAG: VOC family protein [Nitrososphaera sp.]|jgi:catechol 2,3-dioxygenase
MKIGYVSLNVPDLQRSLDFYRSVLGFKTTGRPSGEKALLSCSSVGNSHGPRLIELLQTRSNNNGDRFPKRAGLYHFAVLLPQRKFLADMLENLNEKRDMVHFEGMANHLVSESIYIRDPDLNGIEIYCDRPRSEWSWSAAGNRIHMSTERLDVQDLLKDRTGTGWKEMPGKTTIGHMHLHVSNLAKAQNFYSEILGLDLTCVFPGALFFAADRYHHHIATNTWLGEDLVSASPGDPGLNHFSIELPASELENMTRHLASRGVPVEQEEDKEEEPRVSIKVRDPDGIQVRICFRNSLQ